MAEIARDIVDKRGILPTLARGSAVVVELGCGPRKSIEGALGVDVLDTPAVDLVGDAVSVLARFPEGSVARIASAHFFEHVGNLEEMLASCARALEDGGRMDVVVPHFSNPYFYSDFTHRAPFGLYTFSYLADERIFRRKVPHYSEGAGFELRSVDLVFKSPWAGRNAIKRAVGALVNLSTGTKEFYEENLAFLFPCYEIHYVLARVPRAERAEREARAAATRASAT